MTGGSTLGPTIKMELMERLPSMKFVREAYGLAQCGFITYTYPK